MYPSQFCWTIFLSPLLSFDIFDLLIIITNRVSTVLTSIQSAEFHMQLLMLYCILLPGFPILGIEWQKMENPDLRKAMGMKTDQKGVRIRRIEPTAPESGCMQPSDIILSFDGIDIANDGTGLS